jgi:hypothetical protein
VLRVPHVGLDDNFFDIGGDSLLMVQAYGKLREATSTSLSVIDLFRYPTIRLLAGAIAPPTGICTEGRSGTGGHESQTVTLAESIQKENLS